MALCVVDALLGVINSVTWSGLADEGRFPLYWFGWELGHVRRLGRWARLPIVTVCMDSFFAACVHTGDVDWGFLVDVDDLAKLLIDHLEPFSIQLVWDVLVVLHKVQDVLHPSSLV